jgi:hypothetical protein
MEDLIIKIYTIYKNPSDYPDKHVVRLWEVSKEGVLPHTNPIIVCDTLEQARLAIPKGLVSTGRKPDDDPVIVESYI